MCGRRRPELRPTLDRSATTKRPCWMPWGLMELRTRGSIPFRIITGTCAGAASCGRPSRRLPMPCVRDGKIVSFVVTNGGSGYSSSPTVTVRDFERGDRQSRAVVQQTIREKRLGRVDQAGAGTLKKTASAKGGPPTPLTVFSARKALRCRSAPPESTRAKLCDTFPSGSCGHPCRVRNCAEPSRVQGSSKGHC